MRLFCFILMVVPVFFNAMNAQETIVIGYVRSKIDKSPLSAVNVYFEGTTVGTQTDEEGFYVLRHPGNEAKVVFSSIGYKNQVVTIRPGQPVSVNIELREDVGALQELFVFPGVNPATLLMKKVREAAAINDVSNTDQTFKSEEEELVLMPVNGESSRRRFDKWTSGLVSEFDSSVFIPLYLASESYLHRGRYERQTIERKAVASPENLMVLMEKISGNFKSEINFYNNNIVMFGKNLVSPLSTAGNAFYRFYLIDSVASSNGKQYYLRFWSKNQKNLVFNGEMYIDSATLALTDISVQLPRQANLNYINQLSVRQQFAKNGQVWIPSSTKVKTSMSYAVQVDSNSVIPAIYSYRSIRTVPEDTVLMLTDGFAGSKYQKEELEFKLAELNDIPIMKAARWIADIVITGYAQAGIIDLGKIYQFARLTDQEGLRLTLPLRTNEQLSPYFSVGGYWGYGFASKQHYYSLNAGVKLPFDRKTIFRTAFTDDLRRTDFAYNEFMVKENPLLSGDVDIANTLISMTSANRLNRRKEWSFSVTHDWSDDIESALYARSNRYFSTNQLPFITDTGSDESYLHQSLTFMTRISNRERTYEDHLDRIYIQNELPVVYLSVEGGNVSTLTQQTQYAKLMFNYKHKVLFSTGQWMYSMDAGWLVGTVPYNLLFIHGSDKAIIHRRLHFNLMGYMEFVYDKYISTHHEFIFNGILFNSVPVLRNFNLRELITLKGIYGGFDRSRIEVYQMPATISVINKPYFEVGVGIANIFKVGSLQSVWRLTDRDKPGISPWGIVAGIRFNF